jgi:hypothetical protein
VFGCSEKFVLIRKRFYLYFPTGNALVKIQLISQFKMKNTQNIKMVRIKDVIKRKKHLSRFLLTINVQQANFDKNILKDAMNGVDENLELFLKIKLNNK